MFIKKILKIFLFFFVFCNSVYAELKIDITSGYTEPTPIGLSQFTGTNDKDKLLAKEISD